MKKRSIFSNKEELLTPGGNIMGEQVQDLQAALQAALQNIQQSHQQQWGGQPQQVIGGMPAATSVQVPMKIPVGMGSVRVYLTFDAEWGSNRMKLEELINTLLSSGAPVDVYTPKQYNNNYRNNYQQQNRGYQRSYQQF